MIDYVRLAKANKMAKSLSRKYFRGEHYTNFIGILAAFYAKRTDVSPEMRKSMRLVKRLIPAEKLQKIRYAFDSHEEIFKEHFGIFTNSIRRAAQKCGVPMQEFTADASLAGIYAIHGYDNIKFKFCTYFASSVFRSCVRWNHRLKYSVDVPYEFSKSLGEVTKIKNNYQQQLGRSVTADELIKNKKVDAELVVAAEIKDRMGQFSIYDQQKKNSGGADHKFIDTIAARADAVQDNYAKVWEIINGAGLSEMEVAALKCFAYKEGFEKVGKQFKRTHQTIRDAFKRATEKLKRIAPLEELYCAK